MAVSSSQRTLPRNDHIQIERDIHPPKISHIAAGMLPSLARRTWEGGRRIVGGMVGRHQHPEVGESGASHFLAPFSTLSILTPIVPFD